MTLDVIAAALTGFMAVCLFVLHIVSARHWPQWPTLPEYLRRGLLIGGALLTWRSVNLISLAGQAQPIAGHINAEGLITTGGMAYAIGALTFWSVSEYMPKAVRFRLEWMTKHLRREPDLRPVLLDVSEVNDLAHAAGIAAIGPREGAQAVIREDPRAARAQARARG